MVQGKRSPALGSNYLERSLLAEEFHESRSLFRLRMQSTFLRHCDHGGLFADFHSVRHLFIASIERAGIRPKMAQVLARH
jgi:hypothetical protein